MTFGQTSGPPATAAQLGELAELFERMGFESFREARHPYGLSQRQSNGKFTRTEADELIDRLQCEADGVETDGSTGDRADDPDATNSVVPRPKKSPVPAVREPAESAEPVDVALAFPDEILADELRRRGWACIPPAEALD
jgi:hypothetical protein